MIKVLFVCLGNICRSPLAEGIFDKMVKNRQLENLFSCDSAGTAAYHIGKKPDYRSIMVAKENGITLNHKAKQFDRTKFGEFEYIIAMDQSNFENIKASFDLDSRNTSKLFKMRDFDSEGKGKDIPDPYYGEKDGFQEVYELLENSCENFLKYLCEKHDSVKN